MVMYLRVKKDSVTSILLFIFNVFLVERGVYSVPLRKIFRLLEPFQKSETSIRMGLSRGVQNGLFVNEKQGQEVYYRLTDQAMQSFEYWQKTMVRFKVRIKLQQANWNRTWSIVLLDLTHQNNPDDNVQQFADALERLGFGSLNKGQWLSPYDFSGDVIKLADKYFLKKELIVFAGNLQNHKPESIVFEIWPVLELAHRYKKYLTRMEKEADALNTQPGAGQSMPFLYLYGSELFEIIQDDPQLPLELLPADWLGPKVAGAFWEIRERLLPDVNNFIDGVLAFST